ncbi:g7098 [Coccomyxa elongata]
MRCDKLFAYQWWKVWYEWGCLMGVMLALAIGRVHVFRVCLAVSLGIATVMLMDATNTFYFAWYRLAHGTAMVRGKVYFSGTLITSIFNFLLIICLGTHDEGADADEFAYGKHHTTGRHATAEPELPGAGMDPEAARAV